MDEPVDTPAKPAFSVGRVLGAVLAVLVVIAIVLAVTSYVTRIREESDAAALFEVRVKYVGAARSAVEQDLGAGKELGAASNNSPPCGLTQAQLRLYSAATIAYEVEYEHYRIVFNGESNVVDIRPFPYEEDDVGSDRRTRYVTGDYVAGARDYWREAWRERRVSGDVWTRDGLWTRWAQQSVLEAQCFYKDGLRDGRYIEWYPGIRLRLDGSYSGGKKHGVWKEWDVDGALLHERNYQNGELAE